MGDFCLVQKKKCVKHNNWEKLRRAEIDMERVRQWLKLDELFEKERQIRTAMAQRAGLLPLMLHSTFNHELISSSQYVGQSSIGNPAAVTDETTPPSDPAVAIKTEQGGTN